MLTRTTRVPVIRQACPKCGVEWVVVRVEDKSVNYANWEWMECCDCGMDEEVIYAEIERWW